MNLIQKISFYSFIINLLFLAIPLHLAGQKNLASTSSNDTSVIKSGDDKHALYAGAGYGNNMIYLGYTISQNQPYSYGNITYGFRNSLYLSATAVNLSRFSRPAAFYIGGLNYSHVFNSWFDISAGAYMYQVDKTLTDTLFNSFNYSDITLGVDWKLLYTKITYGTIVSKEPQGFLQINNSRYFQTPDFFRKKVNISFDPYINLLFGNLLTSEIIDGTTEITTIQQYITPWSSGSTSGSSSGKGSGYGSSSGNGNGSQTDSGSSTTTTTTTTTTVPTTTTTFKSNFDLIEIEFGLPISVNTDFMTIEVEPGYVLPAYSDPYLPGPKGFIFTLTCFLKIF